jgi:REP element-mobilizing transposase RayT
MPRTSRLIVRDEQAVYHVISRTALPGFPIGDIEKDFMLRLIKRLSNFYFTEIIGFCLMGNHFHLLVKMLPESDFSDADVKRRCQEYYGKDYIFPEGHLPHFRTKLANLSEFMRDVKVNFARYYNRRHDRRGYFWGDRFKSVIVDRGETLVNCLAYIDLNPLRAGIVEKPEKYRWSSIGYHIQTGNKDLFLSTDFGLKEFNVRNKRERIRRYRRYMYHAGSIDRPEKGKTEVINPRLLKQEKRKNFQINQASRLRYRTRYFTDSGIIGSKEFVLTHYQNFKHLLRSKKEKKPKPIQGLSGIYSLKQLSEFI